jgi:DNA repair protein RecN (Recombination protein N)
VITAEGRSRGYINGTPCPLGDLKALGELLIDIHSQHEHQSLLKTDTHRRLLDEYAGATDLARQVQLAAQRWRQTRQELERLSNSGDEQRARHQLLSYQLEELENLGLGDNELEQLEQEHKNLTNAETLLGICRQVVEQCSESDSGNVLNALTASLNRLSSVNNSVGALGEASSLLTSAQIQVEEAVGELNRFLDNFDADPARLQYLEERLDTIYTLARKHRIQPTEVAEMQQKLLDEIETLNANDESIERLGDELAAYARHYQEKARELSELRQQAASSLASAVEQEIQRLGMPGGRFTIELRPTAVMNFCPTAWNRSNCWSAPTPASRSRPGEGGLRRRAVAYQPGDSGDHRTDLPRTDPGIRRSGRGYRRPNSRNRRPIAASPGGARPGADRDSLATSGRTRSSTSVCAQGARRRRHPHRRVQTEQK